MSSCSGGSTKAAVPEWPGAAKLGPCRYLHDGMIRLMVGNGGDGCSCKLKQIEANGRGIEHEMVRGMMGYCGGGGLSRPETVSYARGHAAKGIINVDDANRRCVAYCCSLIGAQGRLGSVRAIMTPWHFWCLPFYNIVGNSHYHIRCPSSKK